MAQIRLKSEIGKSVSFQFGLPEDAFQGRPIADIQLNLHHRQIRLDCIFFMGENNLAFHAIRTNRMDTPLSNQKDA